MIKVFYNEKQSVKDASRFSPSAGKPELIVGQWSEKFPIEIVSDFKPMTKKQIALVHDPKYVHDVLKLKISNGFGNWSKDVAKSLPWTSGSMVAAAIYAYRNRWVAVSPTSGFHHACYSRGGGYCTFNGIMIAAKILNDLGCGKIGIIDFDQHWGNGTADIMKYVHFNQNIPHLSCPKRPIRGYLKKLPGLLDFMFGDCDLILYQAGADSHKSDPLGGVFTTAQMRKRDRIVFEFCKSRDIALAWDLAGGYQEPIQKVLNLHNNTMEECIMAFGE